MEENKFVNDGPQDDDIKVTDTEIPANEEVVESFDEDFDDSDILEIPVEVSEITDMSKSDKKKGVTVFLSIIAILLAISIAACAGYILGANSNKSSYNNNLSLNSKPSNDKALTTEQVYDLVNPSVVGITIYDSNGVKGYASGIIYSKDGYIITNDHIYEDVPGAKFRIHDYQSKTYEAYYVAGDTRSDLAVLKVDADDFIPATFGNSAEVVFGESVVAVGRPNGASDASSITKGVVSYPNRRVTGSTNYTSRLIQTDAVINPGSSGGALVNMYGQIIGITSLKIVGNSYEGVGFAIPTVTVKKIVESLIEHKTVVNRGRLGFTYQELDTLTLTDKRSQYGLLVASISDDSDMLGKAVAGDIIIKVNDYDVVSADVLIDLLETVMPGEKLSLTIITKNGTTKTITVKVLHDYGTSSYVAVATNDDLEPLPKE